MGFLFNFTEYNSKSYTKLKVSCYKEKFDLKTGNKTIYEKHYMYSRNQNVFHILVCQFIYKKIDKGDIAKTLLEYGASFKIENRKYYTVEYENFQSQGFKKYNFIVHDKDTKINYEVEYIGIVNVQPYDDAHNNLKQMVVKKKIAGQKQQDQEDEEMLEVNDPQPKRMKLDNSDLETFNQEDFMTLQSVVNSVSQMSVQQSKVDSLTKHFSKGG